MKTLAPLLIAGLVCACAPAKPASTAAEVTGADDIAIGRYLTRIGGCNDCHTPGYLKADGKIPESQWLTGNPVGFRGPWGVSYASNLRLTAESISEGDWVSMLANRTDTPPMPWPSTHAMSDANRRALYHYIRSLGPAGKAAPLPLCLASEKPATPYVDMVPITPDAH